MGRLAGWLRTRAVALGAFGAPGLFLVAFLDSSFLSLPEIADILVVYMVARQKARLLLYAGCATLGSVTGCLVMYYLGKKGGDALVRSRFGGSNVQRAMAAVERHGVMAVLIPAMLPPPAPFKIFVVLAGVAGIGAAPFTVAIAIGRGARYLALGILAVKYGDRAMAYMRENGALAALAVIVLLVAGFAAYLLWYRVQRGKRR